VHRQCFLCRNRIGCGSRRRPDGDAARSRATDLYVSFSDARALQGPCSVPHLEGRLVIGAILLAIMLLNLIVMLMARHILRFLCVLLQILGAVLGIVQVAWGLKLIDSALKWLWNS
jgi:hypothetical protein